MATRPRRASRRTPWTWKRTARDDTRARPSPGPGGRTGLMLAMGPYGSAEGSGFSMDPAASPGTTSADPAATAARARAPPTTTPTGKRAAGTPSSSPPWPAGAPRSPSGAGGRVRALRRRQPHPETLGPHPGRTAPASRSQPGGRGLSTRGRGHGHGRAPPALRRDPPPRAARGRPRARTPRPSVPGRPGRVGLGSPTQRLPA